MDQSAVVVERPHILDNLVTMATKRLTVSYSPKQQERERNAEPGRHRSVLRTNLQVELSRPVLAEVRVF
jgi:hypothetical protein